MTNSLAHILSILTLAADLLFVLGLLLLLIPRCRAVFRALAYTWWREFAFIVAFGSMLGSLALSELAGYVPCDLCWYQRILMYPLVLLFGLALFGKNAGVRLQGLIFSGLGMLIAGYHILLQQGVTGIAPCTERALAVPCGEVLFRDFGYITIPVMSLTAFTYLFVLLLGARRSES